MKTSIQLLALACALFSVRASSTVEKKFDRFKNFTIVTVTSDFGQENGHRTPQLVLLSGFKGDKPRPDFKEAFHAELRFVFDDWKYLECSSVSMLVDGLPVALPRFDHDGTVGRGYVIERLIARLPVDAARQIAEAKTSIEIRVCNDEFSLPISLSSDIKEVSGVLGVRSSNDAPAPPAEPESLDPKELADAAKIIKCNIDQLKRGEPVAAIRTTCGGIFKANTLTPSAPAERSVAP